MRTEYVINTSIELDVEPKCDNVVGYEVYAFVTGYAVGYDATNVDPAEFTVLEVCVDYYVDLGHGLMKTMTEEEVLQNYIVSRYDSKTKKNVTIDNPNQLQYYVEDLVEDSDEWEPR